MFSVIICTYNGRRTIERVIESLLDQEELSLLVEQIIVVDNASTDGTKNIVDRYLTEKLIYSHEKKQGLGYARLNGLRLAKAEWIVFIDDDNELSKDWIKTAAEFIRENQEIGIFGGSVIPKLDFDPTKEELERLGCFKRMLACSDMNRKDIDFKRKVSPFGGIIGAGMVVKKEHLKELEKRGWLKQIGRCGDSTDSGDDSEISYFVTEVLKKEAGFCPYLIIEHNISRNRLEKDYLLRLSASIMESDYIQQGIKKYYVLRRIRSLIKFVGTKNPYQKNSFDYKVWEIRKESYISKVKQDKLVYRSL